MRSYIYIIILLLSVSVLAQDAIITVSFSQTIPKSTSIILSTSAVSGTYDLGSSFFVKTLTVQATIPCCAADDFWENIFSNHWYCTRGIVNAYTYCGSVTLCAGYDDDTTVDCKPLANSAPQQTITYDVNKVIRTVTFAYGGDRTTQTGQQVNINQITSTGGGFAQITRSLPSLRGPDAIFLGLVREKIEKGDYTGDVLISSSNPKAIAWFNEPLALSATTRTTTPSFDDQILACLDSDANKICDYDDERECESQNKDWYNGDCCHDAPFNPESETPPNECQWYSTKNSKQMDAVCGKDADGIWKWAALGDIGLINILSGSCPSMQIVSDGTAFQTCSSGAQNVIPTDLVKPLTEKITILGHEYFCQGENIIECGGESPYSPTAKPSGEAVTYNNQKNYCTTEGKWVTSLDSYGRDSCVAAGLRWTGTKCCGETDDPLKTYEDTYTGQGTAGACYNNQFIPSGSFFAGDKSIINYRGEFAICEPTRTPGTNASTTTPLLTGLTVTAYGPCGTPLQQAILTGTLQHIVCTPSGDWQFTSKTEPHLVKQTLWMPAEIEDKKGCCPENQCWDGQQCKDIGYYYDKIIGKGYRCE